MTYTNLLILWNALGLFLLLLLKYNVEECSLVISFYLFNNGLYLHKIGIKHGTLFSIQFPFLKSENFIFNKLNDSSKAAFVILIRIH